MTCPDGHPVQARQRFCPTCGRPAEPGGRATPDPFGRPAPRRGALLALGTVAVLVVAAAGGWLFGRAVHPGITPAAAVAGASTAAAPSAKRPPAVLPTRAATRRPSPTPPLPAPPRNPFASVDFEHLSHPALDCSGIGLGVEVDRKRYLPLRGRTYAFIAVGCRTSTGGAPEVVEVYAPTQPVHRIGTLLRETDLAKEITGIEVVGDRVTVLADVLRPTDPNCCPSGHTRRSYVFDGTQLRPVGA